VSTIAVALCIAASALDCTSSSRPPAGNGTAPGSTVDGGVTTDPRGSGWHNVVVGGGGFISGIVYHPAVPGLAYLRTDMGGAYRLDPGADTWRPITDSIERADADFLGVLSLAVDAENPDRVVLMTGKYTQSWAGPGAVLISNDRGSSWTRTRIPAKVGGNEDGRGAGERLQIDPKVGSSLLMGTTRDGLLQSSDGALTWSKVASFAPTSVNFVLYDPGAEAAGERTQRIFVGVADTAHSLWLTSDGGASWAEVPAQPAGLMALRGVISGANLYITYGNGPGPNGVTAGAVWKLHTGSLTWSVLPVPTGTYGFGGVSAAGPDGEHLVVSTLDRWAPQDEIYHSSDGGSTWSPLLQTATFDRSFAPYTANSRPHWLADVKLDPADPEHLMFVTGYGLWDCRGVAAPPLKCAFQNRGIEQTVAMQLIAPPSGAPLLSAMGDIDGFRHEQFHESPASGRYQPLRGTTLGIAYAEAAPLTVVKQHKSSPFGSYSRDGGVTWTGFASRPPGTTAGGTKSIAISADGQTVVWTPDGAGTFYSTDMGASWQPSVGGMPAGLKPVADRKNADRFYALDPIAGRLLVSADKGISFTAGMSGLPALAAHLTAEGNVAAAFDRADEVWLTLGTGGLYRSTDAGATAGRIASVAAAFAVGFGKAKTDGDRPAVFISGTVEGVSGIFRSDDEGATWVEVSDPAHKFGYIHDLTGDQRTHGLAFLATEGRGVQYYKP